MKKIFVAYNKRNSQQKISSITIKDSIKEFLEKYKRVKEFCVIEYRDGEHRATIGGVGENYYRQEFNKDSAKQFLNTN